MRLLKPREETVSVPVATDDRLADDRLEQLLVATGKVTAERLEVTRHNSIAPGDSLAGRLVAAGLISTEELAATIAAYYSAERIDLSRVAPTPDALALLHREQARALRAVPIAVDEQGVRVAVVDPSPEHVALVQAAIGRPVHPLVATHQGIVRALDAEYRVTDEVGRHVRAFETRDELRRESEQRTTGQANEDAPVVQVVQKIITQGLHDRASDIHLEPAGERVRVRYRIDGALVDVLDLPGSIGPALVSRVKILAGMNIVERRRPQDGQISMTVDDREVDIRVASTAVVGGEKLVLRLLDKSRPLFRTKQLGMAPETEERYVALLRQPYGMVVCAGPTGGGKTTTLYASLGELDTPERNIMTIEDPVEYTFDSINQIQINEQAGITFAGGLKSILRQDPDVILVGEIRDVDTARIAVQSALTGHLVLSSLHATEAVSALYRLHDMGIEAFLIASSVSAVMAQRLVRRSCTSCLEAYVPSAEELAFLRSIGGAEPVGGFRRGVGCHYCSGTGYLERIGVYELLVVTDAMRELIVDHAPQDSLRKLARCEGMSTLQEQGARLVAEGITTATEVMRSIYVAGV